MTRMTSTVRPAYYKPLSEKDTMRYYYMYCTYIIDHKLINYPLVVYKLLKKIEGAKSCHQNLNQINLINFESLL